MNNGSVRGFERHRYTRVVLNEKGQPGYDFPPSRRNRTSPLDERNKKARKAAKEAYEVVQSTIRKLGYATTRCYALAAFHGFKVFGQPSYRYLHPTKGFMKVPAY